MQETQWTCKNEKCRQPITWDGWRWINQNGYSSCHGCFGHDPFRVIVQPEQMYVFRFRGTVWAEWFQTDGTHKVIPTGFTKRKDAERFLAAVHPDMMVDRVEKQDLAEVRVYANILPGRQIPDGFQWEMFTDFEDCTNFSVAER